MEYDAYQIERSITIEHLKELGFEVINGWVLIGEEEINVDDIMDRSLSVMIQYVVDKNYMDGLTSGDDYFPERECESDMN